MTGLRISPVYPATQSEFLYRLPYSEGPRLTTQACKIHVRVTSRHCVMRCCASWDVWQGVPVLSEAMLCYLAGLCALVSFRVRVFVKKCGPFPAGTSHGSRNAKIDR